MFLDNPNDLEISLHPPDGNTKSNGGLLTFSKAHITS